jgi:hypothetical protein
MIKLLPISELKEAEYNPRKLTEVSRQQIKESIQQFGFVTPAVVNTNPNRKNVLVGGHQRVKIAGELGYTEVPCYLINLSLEEERELNIRLNKNSAHWSTAKLKNLFDEKELNEWGFNPNELDLIFNAPQKWEATAQQQTYLDSLFSQQDQVDMFGRIKYELEIESEKYPEYLQLLDTLFASGYHKESDVIFDAVLKYKP